MPEELRAPPDPADAEKDAQRDALRLKIERMRVLYALEALKSVAEALSSAVERETTRLEAIDAKLELLTHTRGE